MEIGSTLPALGIAVSVLLLAFAEVGVAAISARLQSAAYLLASGGSDRGGYLGRLADIPGGPTVPLRLLGMAAPIAAVAFAVWLSISVWNTGGGLAALSVIVVMAMLVLVTLISRHFGARYSDSLCIIMPRISWLLSFPLMPGLLVYRMILRYAPSKTDSPLDVALSMDADSSPFLDEHEVRMIRGVVQLDQTVAREIMTPRVDIAAVESGTTLDALAEAMNRAGHSRVPVYDGDMDRIEGVAHAKDVLRQIASGRDPSVMTAIEVARPPLFVPESKSLEELLGEFQDRRMHLAVVIDEYGGVSGIVTIEDLLEEIVGEIQDEFDAEEPGIRNTGKSEFMVDASLPIDALNESLGINITVDGFDTIGGLVFEQLGKVPVQGDTVYHDCLRIEVIDTVGRRPNTLRINRTESDDSEYAAQRS